MISVCDKLKDMVKDEKKGTLEYEELQLDVMKIKGLNKEDRENYIDMLDIIAGDEDRHKYSIKQMMKDLKCK